MPALRRLVSGTLGAPGITWLPPEPVRALTDVRMDVCALVGVAPRGDAHVAVAVESWDEYVRRYGAFEGPGLLPYAAASFFENGGVRAYVVRIPAGTAAVASAPMSGLRARAAGGDVEIWLRARNAGAWGNALRATLSLAARPLAVDPSAFTSTGFTFARGVDVAAGTLLRLDHGGGARSLVRVAQVWEEWHPEQARIERHAAFDAPVALPVARAEIVEGTLDVDDGDGRTERHVSLGMSPPHPRWIATVLAGESQLVEPGENLDLGAGDPRRTWDDRDLALGTDLPTYATASFAGGADHYADIVPEDFFDAAWTPGDEDPGRGVHALTQLDDLSIVVAPDLYSPRPLAPLEPVTDGGGAGAEFCACVPIPPAVQAVPPEDLDGLRLDPSVDLAAIVALQRRLVALADVLEAWVVLLDVPPGLSQRQILRWRGELHSTYAAAYHPWLRVSRADDQRDAAIDVPPSAVAAGIVAARANALGVQYGPANVLAEGVFDVSDRVSPARHDELHPQAINVYLHERDGVRLTAARTLSPDPRYRQLSVRRLMTMLRRVLLRQMQWAVFEPNSERLRADVRNQLDAYLRRLFAADAFAGARPEDAFFVRCDDEINPPAWVDQGRLLAYVGVAPAEPLEFIVVQLAREGDGTLRATDGASSAPNTVGR